jgi:hypothetical protein
MRDQIHIRGAEAAHLARTLARETGRTMNDVVLDALRQYRPRRPAARPQRRVAKWQELLREDRAQRKDGREINVEYLCDKASGLPK